MVATQPTTQLTTQSTTRQTTHIIKIIKILINSASASGSVCGCAIDDDLPVSACPCACARTCAAHNARRVRATRGQHRATPPPALHEPSRLEDGRGAGRDQAAGAKVLKSARECKKVAKSFGGSEKKTNFAGDKGRRNGRAEGLLHQRHQPP